MLLNCIVKNCQGLRRGNFVDSMGETVINIQTNMYLLYPKKFRKFLKNDIGMPFSQLRLSFEFTAIRRVHQNSFKKRRKEKVELLLELALWIHGYI